MCACPHCGSPYPEGNLRVDLNTDRLLCRGEEIRLPPQVTDFLAALLEREGKPLPLEHLAVKIWGVNRAPSGYRNVLSVYTARLRKVIKPFGYDIYMAGRGGDRTLALAKSFNPTGQAVVH